MLISIQEVLGRRTLILGETGSGKTRLTAELLDSILDSIDPSSVTVIDMSPTTVPGIGGRVSEYTAKTLRVRYLVPEAVRAPRIEGKSRKEVLNFAELNRMAIEPLLHQFLKSPTRILFMNDVSIYLHSGDISKIFKCVELSDTVVANSYYGESLLDDKGSGISIREKRLVEILSSKFDNVLRLSRHPYSAKT